MMDSTVKDREAYDLPYEGWPDCWDEYGTRPGDDRPVVIRVGLYKPHGDHGVGSVAICTSDSGPILISEDSANGLRELLKEAIDSFRRDVRDAEQERLRAAHEVLDTAVLTREQWQTVLAAVDDGEPNNKAAEALKASAPTAWTDEQQ